MAGQWPVEVLDSMKYKGEHLESPLTPNHSFSHFDSEMQAWNGHAGAH